MNSHTDKSTVKYKDALKAFSREHHLGLQLSWKIRKGLNNDVDLKRIKKYSDWFYETYIRFHLEEEEKYIFPILGKEHKLVKKSITRHRRLKRLFSENTNLVKSLNQIEEELERHIRFEEKELYLEVQKHLTPQELVEIEKQHKKLIFIENEEDVFWQ